MTIRGGGVRRLMEKTILNFHFDYLNTSLKHKNSTKTNGKKHTLNHKSVFTQDTQSSPTFNWDI